MKDQNMRLKQVAATIITFQHQRMHNTNLLLVGWRRKVWTVWSRGMLILGFT